MKPRPTRSLFFPWLALALAIIPSFQTFAFAQPALDPAPEAPSATPESPEPPEKPQVAEAPEPASVAEESVSAAEPKEAEAAPAKPAGEEKTKAPRRNRNRNDHWHRSDGARFNIGQNSTLELGGEADAVVSIFGSSTSDGTVRDAVVSIFGSSTSSGDVGDAVVSIFGNSRVTGGSVGDASVAVFGNNYVNGHVRGQVVAVFGNVELGPDAVVDGKLVCIGGHVKSDPKAIVRLGINMVPIGDYEFGFQGLTAWFNQCLRYGRPLAFGSHLMWAWWIALTYLGLYALIALVTPESVTKCVQTLETRPGKSILAALLTMLLTPVVYVLLAFTILIVIGVALIPLFTLGLFFAGLFGKAVMLSWLGRRVAKLWNAGEKFPVVATVLIGGAIVLALYTVPGLGFVVYKLLGILGLGVVIYTLLLSIRSNRPVPIPPPVAAAPVAAVVEPAPVQTPEFAAPPPVLPQVAPLSPVISAATLPRAGFWIRIAAALLDVIMVSILFGVLNGMFSWFFRVTGSFPLWFAVYNIAMWATKGTTIGGIICGLKVVRLDDRPIDAGVAIVRGISAFLSLAVAGLGFIWVGFDDAKQSWHDKIAGTTIVLVPKGMSLL